VPVTFTFGGEERGNPMNWSRLLSAMAGVALSAGVAAADLTKIDRAVRKEPAYRGSPKYCLLVLGPEAKTRVWLVLDDDVLYVDRNGNGDLTEPGEQVKGAPALLSGLLQPGERAPEARNHDCVLADKSSVSLLTINGSYFQVDFKSADGKRSLSAHQDDEGPLLFAVKPGDAPIVHFDGPLTLSLPKQTLKLGKEPGKLAFLIGTPGLGKGAFASLSIQSVPKELHPVAEIEFPPAHPGGKPAVGRFVLDRRC
jgi:hypothetical protein